MAGKRVSVYDFNIIGRVVIPSDDNGTTGTKAQAAIAAATTALGKELGDGATVKFKGEFGSTVLKEPGQG
jgi:hypothetical protein